VSIVTIKKDGITLGGGTFQGNQLNHLLQAAQRQSRRGAALQAARTGKSVEVYIPDKLSEAEIEEETRLKARAEKRAWLWRGLNRQVTILDKAICGEGQ
jgi:hypothetical protein